MTGRIGIHDAQTATAQTQHGVGLAHAVDLLHELTLRGDDLGVSARSLEFGDFDIKSARAFEELVQRRIEQAHDDRQAVHGLEHAVEIARLSLEQVGDGLFAHGLVLVEDEGLDDLLAIAQEHMLGTVEADALGAERAGQLGIGRVVGIGANAQAAELVGPFEDDVKIAGELGHDQLDRAQNDDARGAVDRDHVAFADDDIGAGDDRLFLLGVDLERLDAAHARRAHAAGDNGGMAGLAAMGGQDALGGDHAGEVVGVGLPADEHALAAFGLGGHGIGGGEDRFAHGGARACVQTASENVVFGVLVELRM